MRRQTEIGRLGNHNFGCLCNSLISKEKAIKPALTAIGTKWKSTQPPGWANLSPPLWCRVVFRAGSKAISSHSNRSLSALTEPFTLAPHALPSKMAPMGRIMWGEAAIYPPNCSVSLFSSRFKSLSFLRTSSIFSTECSTVVWCLPPNCRPISGSEASVRCLARYMAICRG
jgi:hypothetical protein